MITWYLCVRYLASPSSSSRPTASSPCRLAVSRTCLIHHSDRPTTLTIIAGFNFRGPGEGDLRPEQRPTGPAVRGKLEAGDVPARRRLAEAVQLRNLGKLRSEVSQLLNKGAVGVVAPHRHQELVRSSSARPPSFPLPTRTETS